jgi:3-oxoadipate enol-lactonase
MISGTVRTEGAEIYFQSHGQGPAVVLAHGVGGNHAIWYRQIGPLSQSNRVITFDHRGFGLSTDLDGRGRSAFVDDLLALLDHLEIDRAALVGQSMGAGTCVGLACRAPTRVAALVIADSLHGIEESPEVKALMDKARAATNALSQIDRVLGAVARVSNPELAVLYNQINSFNSVGRHRLVGEFSKCSVAELGALGMPTLFIAGVGDVLFPIEAIRLVHANTPGSFIVEINDTGHSAFLEQPRAFNDTILTLLQMAGHVGKAEIAHSNAPGYVPIV